MTRYRLPHTNQVTHREMGKNKKYSRLSEMTKTVFVMNVGTIGLEPMTSAM